MKAHTIDEVIAHLDTIINQCMANQSCRGYFASLYRKMSVAVKAGVGNGAFEDGGRMERLVVEFANRYLDAYAAYASAQQLTTSWRSAFDAAQNNELTIIQHLLLGINAHINLDLGIAAAVISTPQNIRALHPDFLLINDTIAHVYNDMQSRLSKISWFVVLIQKIRPETTNALINFSIAKARDTAWNNALMLTNIGTDGHQQVITTTDAIVAKVATGIQSPGKIARLLFKWIRKAEKKDIVRNLRVLNEEG